MDSSDSSPSSSSSSGSKRGEFDSPEYIRKKLLEKFEEAMPDIVKARKSGNVSGSNGRMCKMLTEVVERAQDIRTELNRSTKKKNKKHDKKAVTIKKDRKSLTTAKKPAKKRFKPSEAGSPKADSKKKKRANASEEDAEGILDLTIPKNKGVDLTTSTPTKKANKNESEVISIVDTPS